MKTIIKYFCENHLLANVIFFGVLIVSFVCWNSIGKEELPEFARDNIRVLTIYPGAPAEDVELFVTKPVEEELKGVSGIYDIKSTSSLGSSILNIEIDSDHPDKDQVIQDIKDAVLRVDFPAEVRDLPTFRQFKSSEKAIIDIAIYNKKAKYLDQKSRSLLQKYVLNLEHQLVALPEISSVEKSGYLSPELKILMQPEKLASFDISVSEIHNQIKSNHIRTPIGSLSDKGESKITALHELDNAEALQKLVLRGSYAGPYIRLDQIGRVEQGFEKSTSVKKVQGHEAIVLNVRKSLSTDILSAKNALNKFIEQYKTANSDSPIEIVLMDDESYDVTNRLSLITTNGVLGFVLIMLVLFIFLDMKTGFWVAMGIPFALAFTIILTLFVGYDINNMTLAGIIIVMGIVVDDAIIIAENIIRHQRKGLTLLDSALTGTREMFAPVMASILTTYVAFIPLLFFEGFLGQFVSYIPLMIVFMLLGSLIESVIILPSHMVSEVWLLKSKVRQRRDWFSKCEKSYQSFLSRLLKFKILILVGFCLFLGVMVYLFHHQMRFSMFPREETKEVFIKVEAEDQGLNRYETAKLMEPIENIFIQDQSHVVVAVRSSVGESRHGGLVKEYEGWLRVELLPSDERDEPLSDMMRRWELQAKAVKGFKKVKFFKSWFGHGSGSAIEILVQENNDKNRTEISEDIKSYLEKIPSLSHVEIQRPLEKKEFLFQIDQQKLVQLRLDPVSVSTSLRAFVEGNILYTLNKGDEEVDVRLTVPEDAKIDLTELLNLRVENKEGRLIDLKNIIKITEAVRPTNIQRMNYKRSMTVYGDLSLNPKKTPLEIARILESDLFPKIYKKYPAAVLRFMGEIEDSRKSKGDFQNSIFMALVLIYGILVVMFNSLKKPIVILAIVPFGFAGAMLALMLHGMQVYGFFAVVGALGMIGVVVNDSIVMVDQLEKAALKSSSKDNWIATVASTRLRPILLTTITTVVAILPTAYGFAGYDSMLAEMMLTMGWGLAFSTIITLVLVPCLYGLIDRRKVSQG